MRHLRVLEAIGVRAIAVPTRAERVHDPALASFTPVVALREARAQGAEHVIIATDTGRHVSDARNAIDEGFHVLVEKPLAPSTAGLAALEVHARERGAAVFVGCCLRQLASLRAFRAALPKIGGVHAVRIECQSYLPDWRPGTDYRRTYAARATEGGVLRDLVHEIDYATWLFGRPSALTAVLSSTGRLGIDAEEAADLLWRSPAGAMVSLRLDYVTRPARRWMRADGELGSLEWDARRGLLLMRGAAGEEVVDRFAAPKDEMYAAQACAFLDATSSRSATTGLATFDDGAYAVAMIEAAHASSQSGCREAIISWTMR
jgi:predicted dehydrogenase